MVISSIIKHLLCDNDSLDSYFKGIPVSFNDVVRRLFLLDRQGNKNIPDHYYTLNKDFSMREINSLSDILTEGVLRIAKEYLEFRENRVYVKQGLQSEWQQLITEIPPLLLVSSLLADENSIDTESIEDIRNFYHEYIVPNTKYTALPSPYLPQLELYVKESRGFDDLNMHLNGSTETDVAWQDFLFAPDKASKELFDSFEKSLVKEQLEQVVGFIDPLQFKSRLRSALRIRSYFKKILFPRTEPDSFKINDTRHLLSIINSDMDEYLLPDSIYHPFYSIIYDDNNYNRSKLLSIESLMYVLLFKYLRNCPKEGVALAFHYYLQILGLSNRLLVQQTDQYGFIQFQKITSNGLRSYSEEKYKNRFLQLHGNDLRNINFLEGRFSPKPTQRKTEELINSITKGWDELKKELKREIKQDIKLEIKQEINDERCEYRLIEIKTEKKQFPQLKLIAHFIKSRDSSPDDRIRHKTLRYKIWNQALVLSHMKKNGSPHMKNVVGIDAAASEFDTPPEVFAPIFRMLRRSGFKHFTYHAGEDFYHIIGGLRAIYETVLFNDLRCGDRIGHATATGLSAKIWKNNIGEKMLIRKGEYLDDLTFAYHLIIRILKDCGNSRLKDKIPFLTNKIQELSHQIYGKHYTLKTIEDAWLLRKYCPMIVKVLTLPEVEGWEMFKNENTEQTAGELSSFEKEEWCAIKKEIMVSCHSSENAELYMKYHNNCYRKAYDKIIEIDIDEIFSLEDIELLQLSILKFLHEKEIVIETLPTSNIRIGHHSSIDSYHLWNWIKWEEEGYCIPPIVVGTDDTGIFATNIYNEFANIYCFLTKRHNMSHSKAMEKITIFERNAKIYKFT